MKKFFFMRTVADKGRNRLRLLSGQYLDSLPLDPTWNVQSDRALRVVYPIGTTFGTSSLKKASGFYVAGNIYPLGLRSTDYRDSSHIAPEEMTRAYEVFSLGLDEDSSKDKEREDFDEPTRNSYLNKLKKNKDFDPPTISENGFYVDFDNWYLLLRNIQSQVNTMMVGPTGTGKTELVLLACKKLGIPCHVYDMGSMYDPISGLLGVHRLQKGGVSTFDYAKFTKDISEPGVVLLDELSRAPVTTNNILFPCLDSRRSLPIEIAGGNDLRSIKVHEDCCFVATANVGAEYTGTMSLDRALVGRFFPLELDYMPFDFETEVLMKRCKISKKNADLIVRVADNVRSLYRKQDISCSLSTRETLMAAELVSDGWELLKAMELVFLPLFEGTMAEGERSVIAKIIMAM